MKNVMKNVALAISIIVMVAMTTCLMTSGMERYGAIIGIGVVGVAILATVITLVIMMVKERG